MSDIVNGPQSRSKPRSTGHPILPILAAALTMITMSTSILPTPPAHAGEVGAKITKAVTTSDLGISVRTSVVKGAQLMDSIDGKWERFSDNFGLGAERSKQVGRPKPKAIPPLQKLNVGMAQRLLDLSDQAFLKSIGPTISASQLQQEIDTVARLVQVSFERSGVEFPTDGASLLQFDNAAQFNFATYVHYKAYSNIILNQKDGGKSFNAIRSDFERAMGQALLDEWKLKASNTNRDASSSLSALNQQTHQLATILVDNGLAAAIEEPTVNADDWEDVVAGDLAELNWNVAVDGDATLNAQILLQEQGFRLYPNFARHALQQVVQESLTSAQAKATKVSVMDYYFDTDYNSDPDKFEVKEVLLGVSVESD